MAVEKVLLERVRGEYFEMPGLQLTISQACRLWQLDRATCEAVLGHLVGIQFLRRTSDEMYARSSATPYSRQLRVGLGVTRFASRRSA